MLLRCAAAALRPRVPSPVWVVCAHAHSHTRARCSQNVRSLATPDRHPFIYFPDSGHKTPGHQDTRTLGHPLLFLCLLCFALLAISATDRQCDSATVRRNVNRVARMLLPAARCPLPTAACEHHPQPTRLWLNPDRSMHGCTDGKWKLLHSSNTTAVAAAPGLHPDWTGRTEWRV